MDVRTKANTTFDRWYAFSVAAFAKLGFPVPDREAAKDAYEMGESPETWASYVAYS